MQIHRTENPDWLSNAYLVTDEAGKGVLIDGNGVAGPLLERIDSDGIEVCLILLTHEHWDHVDLSGYERFDAPVLAHPATSAALDGVVDRQLEDGETVDAGGLHIRTIYTPGHAAGHVAYLVNTTDCFTADVIFKGTVGGTRAPGAGGIADLRRSVMERLLTLPGETRLHPGHREPTTVAEELASNPFVRAWRGEDELGSEPCKVGGEEAELLLWGPDYDGTHKAWVRFPSGEEAIVGGSQVERQV